MPRFSFFFFRIFRLRTRRASKVPQSSSIASGKSSRTRLQPIVTTFSPSTRRPHSVFVPAILSPIIQSPLTTPGAPTPITDDPTPILIIGQETASSDLSAPAFSDDAGSQSHAKRVSLVGRRGDRVSFQLPTQKESRPESLISTCSTLVADREAHAETATRLAVLPQKPFASQAADSPVASAGANMKVPNVALPGPERVRPTSLLNPQPVRAKVTRFSLPAERTVPILTTGTGRRDDRKGNKRSSLSAASNSGSAKKANRASRWSRELNKPETQEVLRILASTSLS